MSHPKRLGSSRKFLSVYLPVFMFLLMGTANIYSNPHQSHYRNCEYIRCDHRHAGCWMMNVKGCGSSYCLLWYWPGICVDRPSKPIRIASVLVEIGTRDLTNTSQVTSASLFSDHRYSTRILAFLFLFCSLCSSIFLFLP